MPENTILSQSDIDFILKLLGKARSIAVDMQKDAKVFEKTGPYDKVTEADHAISKLLITGLSERFINDTVISEESESFNIDIFDKNKRTWLIDPIDGTNSYADQTNQYAVMIGLVYNKKPVFGFVLAPSTGVVYYGGPNYKLKTHSFNDPNLAQQTQTIDEKSNCFKNDKPIRIIMGYRDRKKNPWINEIPNVQIVKSGSIGIKIMKIIQNEADLFVHFDSKLKTWDTAGPIAIAMAFGLEVASLQNNEISFPDDGIILKSSLVIGKTGSLAWSQKNLINHK